MVQLLDSPLLYNSKISCEGNSCIFSIYKVSKRLKRSFNRIYHDYIFCLYFKLGRRDAEIYVHLEAIKSQMPFSLSLFQLWCQGGTRGTQGIIVFRAPSRCWARREPERERDGEVEPKIVKVNVITAPYSPLGRVRKRTGKREIMKVVRKVYRSKNVR